MSGRERTPREALADLIWHNTDEPMWSAMVLAEQFMTSDWLAARDATKADRVQRETAEGIAQAIEELDPPSYFDAPQYREGLVDGYGLAAAVAREMGR